MRCTTDHALVPRVVLLTCGVGLFALGFPPVVSGQGTDASIIGQVRDESGGILPGVTVTAKSAALQLQEMTSVTDERGEYRLTPLPIGTYTVEYVLTGFQMLRREELRLTAGFVARVDVTLKLGSLEETVTVSGQSPVVDVASTAATTQFTRESMEVLPSGRTGIVALISQAPGVRANLDVGGDTFNDTVNYRAFGQIGEPWATLEGVRTDSPKTDNQAGNYWDFNSFEEARIRTVGNDAEMPRRGIQLAGIVKSGSNDFHGNGFYAFTNGSFQSNNVTDALRAFGINRGAPLVSRWDVSGELGGRIVRNKLWFFTSGRGRRNVDEELGAFMPDGSPAHNVGEQAFHTDKVSYQMSQTNRLIGFYQWNLKSRKTAGTQFIAYESRTDQPLYSQTGKVEWQHVRGNSMVTTLQYGHWRWSADYQHTAPEKPATRDIRTLMQTGDSTSGGNMPTEWRHHTKGTVSWYRPDLFAGNHEFKGGVEYLASTIARRWKSRASGNYRLLFDNSVPFQIETWNYPVFPLNPTNYLGAYVTDTWTIARRLTLNLGFRYAHDDAFVPEQCRADAVPRAFAPAACFPKVQLEIWNSVAPRLHAAYDLFGDGKTVVKGGWGRFDHVRGSDEVQLGNKNLAVTTTFRWRDLNGNRDYDAGEVNLDQNGPDFVSIAGTADLIGNPNEEQPKVDEFTLSVERELMQNFGVRVTGIYSRYMNTHRLQNNLRPYSAYSIPITNPDPGPDGVVGNGDDTGRLITYWDFPVAYRGRQFEQGMFINDPNADSNFRSFEIAASKRLSNRWQFDASYSATKSYIPLVTNIGGGLQYPLNTFDPNSEINALNNTWEWLGKVSGAYMLPAEVMVSGNFEHRSGSVWAREVLFRGGQQIPSFVARVEPIGSQRLPNVNLTNLRVEKRFSFVAGHRLSARLNIYNALNLGTVTGVTQRAGTAFKRPTGILSPRIVELSAQYSF